MCAPLLGSSDRSGLGPRSPLPHMSCQGGSCGSRRCPRPSVRGRRAAWGLCEHGAPPRCQCSCTTSTRRGERGGVEVARPGGALVNPAGVLAPVNRAAIEYQCLGLNVAPLTVSGWHYSGGTARGFHYIRHQTIVEVQTRHQLMCNNEPLGQME